MMAKRILVPIGDNERAEAIVPVVAALARDGGGTVRLLNVQPLQRTRFDDYARRLPLHGYDAGVTLEVQQRVLLDRKSTRLNSSHLVISYAVFCLKKKKMKTPRSQHAA